MLSLLSLLALTISQVRGDAYGRLNPVEAWREELTLDFFDLDFKANFENWMLKFDKRYPNQFVGSKKEAFETFMRNWKMVNDFNRKRGNTFTMRMNQFGDLTAEQFRLYIRGGSKKSCMRPRTVSERAAMKKWVNAKSTTAPTAIDWTNVNGKSYVTAVKNQGQCGSCWAFSTTGAIESRSAIALDVTGSDITTLSEQQLVDCSRSYGNLGCNGGLMDDAFKYVIHEGGLCSEKEYPYTAKDGSCKSSTCGKEYYPISTYTDVQHHSETSLVDAVATGPVSVAIQADQTAFQFYSGGVLDGKCGTQLDHGVLVVGYGTQGGQDFWKVKNSWGKTWGMDGYILICRNCNKNGNQGECGILDTPSYPHSSSKTVKSSPNFLHKLLRRFHW